MRMDYLHRCQDAGSLGSGHLDRGVVPQPRAPGASCAACEHSEVTPKELVERWVDLFNAGPVHAAAASLIVASIKR